MDTFEQRRDDFHDLYDVENDPGVTLTRLVRAGGEFIAEIVGPENADPGMSRVIESLAQAGGGVGSGTDWRALLEERESYAFSEWPMGRLLHSLSAFAQYGIDIEAKPGEDKEAIEARLVERVAAAEGFLERCPLDAWLGPDRARRFDDPDPDHAHSDQARQLERTVAMARCRLALDRGQAVDPADLAELGNLSQSRMRSLISGKTPELKREDSKIPAGIARLWIEDRKGFLPSIWASQRPRENVQEVSETAQRLEEPLFLPLAKDGSIFHPGLAREDGFRIGPKGDERSVRGFREALAELQAMPVPYWRRPSATSGTPGIVRGEDWVRKSASDFTDGL